MSLMAGFDLVAEIAAHTVADLVRANLSFAGTSLVAPFELLVPITGGGPSGGAHVIVNAVDVALTGDHDVTVTLQFADSSVIITTPSIPIAPLAGTIQIGVPLTLSPAGGSPVALTADLAQATVALSLDGHSKTVIASALAPLGFTAAQFSAYAQSAIRSFVQQQPSPSFGAAFSVVSGTDGSLSPLAFERLEPHNIGTDAVGLFGILLAANDAQGDHTQKTSTAIAPGHDVAVSIAPGAFRSLIFCPGVATAVGQPVSALPSACGGASGVDVGGATLTSIDDGFADGHIDVNGSVERSGFCYDAHGSFHASLTLTVSGTTVTPHVSVDEPNVSVDIPWYCWLAAGVILGPIGILIVAIVSAIANSAAQSLADGAISGALGGGLGGVTLGTFGSASFDDVAITTEGLTLQGHLSVPVPASSSAQPLVALVGSVTTQSALQISSGTFSIPNGCLAGEYPYTESSQQQAGVYTASCKLVGEPQTYSWSLAYYTGYYDGEMTPTLVSRVDLTGSSGTATLSGVQCSFRTPVPAGTTVTSTVNVDYTVSGGSVTLTNRPAEGNYSLSLEVQVVDPSGLTVTSSTPVGFNGESVDIGGGYQQRFANCINTLIQEALALTVPVPWWGGIQGVQPPPPVNYPAAESLVGLYAKLISMQGLTSDMLVAYAGMAHGASVQRMLASNAMVSRFLVPAEASRSNVAQTFAKRGAALAREVAKG